MLTKTKGGNMNFQYTLIKQIRVNTLKMSRPKFIRELNKISNGNVNMGTHTLANLEDGKKSRISPMELGFVFRVLGKDPNYFYGIGK